MPVATHLATFGIHKYGLFNVVGEVLVEFYISITLAIFAPFDCYPHPNGDTSVLKYPGVICGEHQHFMTRAVILPIDIGFVPQTSFS